MPLGCQLRNELSQRRLNLSDSFNIVIAELFVNTNFFEADLIYLLHLYKEKKRLVFIKKQRKNDRFFHRNSDGGM